MRKINSFIGKLCAVALLALPVVFTSCDDDEVINAPQITGWEVPADIAVRPNESIEFKPVLNMTDPVSYQWSVNGKKVSEESSYTFSTTDPGSYEIVFRASNSSGSDEQKTTVNVRTYYGGFYMVNEGWFGHANETATIQYYNGKWSDYLYSEANGAATGTNAVIHNNVFYYTLKDAAHAVVAFDVNTFEVKGYVDITGVATQGRSFAVVNDKYGILTTNKGAFIVGLTNLTLGPQLPGTSGECTDIAITEDYILVRNSQIKVYNKDKFTFVKNLETRVNTGFVYSKDGNLWGATSDKLIKFDPRTLESSEVIIPANIRIITMAYTPCAIAASPTENAIFFGSGNKKDIYKYIIGNETSLDEPFALIPAEINNYNFYGAGVACHPETGDVYAIYNRGWPEYFKNAIVIYDGKTGVQKEFIDYTSDLKYPFPSMIVFDL